MRKAPHLWREWSTKLSMELYADQLAVALRAARLLRPGGRMVYRSLANPWHILGAWGVYRVRGRGNGGKAGKGWKRYEKVTLWRLWLEKLRLIKSLTHPGIPSTSWKFGMRQALKPRHLQLVTSGERSCCVRDLAGSSSSCSSDMIRSLTVSRDPKTLFDLLQIRKLVVVVVVTAALTCSIACYHTLPLSEVTISLHLRLWWMFVGSWPCAHRPDCSGGRP